MPVRKEKINRELYGFLKSHGYRPQGFLGSGESSGIPEKADFFQFDFMYDEKNYGKVSVSIDGNGNLIVYSGDDVENSPKSSSHDSISFTALKRYLSRFRHMKGLKSFQLSDTDDLEPEMKKREHDRTEGLNEGYYPINKRSSYSDSVPATKIILQHTRVMEEGDQRYRAIEKIFVENVQGERFLLPTNKPGLARVYARHISEGGTPYDERGQHITNLCEEYAKMAGFVRATKNKQFNESAQSLVNEGVNHYNHLRETLHKMSGKRGYTEYFNNYKPALLEDESGIDISEMFMQSSLDPRIESVMPILGKLSKNIRENKLKHVEELEEWADKVIEGPGVGTEKIAGRYDPVEFDEKVNRLRALAKKNPANIDALARKLHAAMKAEKEKEVKEAGPAGKPGDYFDATQQVSTGPVLGNKPQPQHGLRGKLVGESESAKTYEEEITENEGRPYVCVHAKKGKCNVTANSSYEAAQKAAKKWGLKSTSGIDAHVADKPKDPASLEEDKKSDSPEYMTDKNGKTVPVKPKKDGYQIRAEKKKEVKEGQEDLEAILRIIKK